MDRVLIIASGNNGKIHEFSQLLSILPIKVQSQPEGIVVEETGRSFRENAQLKALAISNLTGEWAIADDSGLNVDALQGAPGIYSARYAKNDSERIARLLKELGPTDNRRAFFTAALCIAAPGNKVLIEVEGRCEGLITRSPRGQKGFGYDPVFEVIGTGKTFAEMGASGKKKFGHRGNAFALLLPRLKKILT